MEWHENDIGGAAWELHWQPLMEVGGGWRLEGEVVVVRGGGVNGGGELSCGRHESQVTLL
jgi:hypothetical protein